MAKAYASLYSTDRGSIGGDPPGKPLEKITEINVATREQPAELLRPLHGFSGCAQWHPPKDLLADTKDFEKYARPLFEVPAVVIKFSTGDRRTCTVSGLKVRWMCPWRN